MNAVIKPPAERVEHGFASVVSAKPYENFFPNVGYAIVVGIFKKPDVWSSANEDATIVAKDRCSVGDVISEDSAFIVGAIVVGILKQLDTALLFKIRVGIGIILGVLSDIEVGVFIEVHCNGGTDERL